jgi:hypothetical protein
VAHDAAPRDDPAHFGHVALGADPVRVAVPTDPGARDAHDAHGMGGARSYAAGVREILECYFDKKPIRNEYLIMQGGKLAGVGAHSYSAGNATGGSAEAEKFKKAGGNINKIN